MKRGKLPDFSQAARGCKAKNTGILAGFRVFSTPQTPLFAEKDRDFDFSNSHVIGIAGCFSGVVCFGFLVSAGIVGIRESGKDGISGLVGNTGDPVGLVVGVAFDNAVGVGLR